MPLHECELSALDILLATLSPLYAKVCTPSLSVASRAIAREESESSRLYFLTHAFLPQAAEETALGLSALLPVHAPRRIERLPLSSASSLS